MVITSSNRKNQLKFISDGILFIYNPTITNSEKRVIKKIEKDKRVITRFFHSF